MPIVKAGILYFALVFGAGFVLGPIRVFWVVPHLDERTAELMEMPIILGVMMVAARWIVRQLAVPSTWSSRLGMGGIALGSLLAGELTAVLWLRGLSIDEYVAGRDPVSGTGYLVMLGVFALMPLFVARRGPRRSMLVPPPSEG
jgi:hypothetical protein